MIQSQLSKIERNHNVKFLFAIESGSRAWGFPSPDSDFDVRFVYAHSPDWYLAISPGRDVIELPLENDWDINGWDIQKAIGLLLKPNPVLLEWLSSPIQYRWDAQACDRLNAFADRHVAPRECLTHYYHLSKRTWDQYIAQNDQVKLKKYFYVLRPALAIRWIRANHDQLPPMNFQSLVNGTGLETDLRNKIGELLEMKSKASELGKGSRIGIIDELITTELSWAEGNLPSKRALRQSTRDSADQLFRELIGYKEL